MVSSSLFSVCRSLFFIHTLATTINSQTVVQPEGTGNQGGNEGSGGSSGVPFLTVYADRAGRYERPGETFAATDLPTCEFISHTNTHFGTHVGDTHLSLSLSQEIIGLRKVVSPNIKIHDLTPLLNVSLSNREIIDSYPEHDVTEICRMTLTNPIKHALTELIESNFWYSYEVEGFSAKNFLGRINRDTQIPEIYAHRTFVIWYNDAHKIESVVVVPSVGVPLKAHEELRLTYSVRWEPIDSSIAKTKNESKNSSFQNSEGNSIIDSYGASLAAGGALGSGPLTAEEVLTQHRLAISSWLGPVLTAMSLLSYFAVVMRAKHSPRSSRVPKTAMLRLTAPPIEPVTHSILIGTGTQLVVTLLLGLLLSEAFVSPDSSSSVVGWLLWSYVLSQPVNGFVGGMVRGRWGPESRMSVIAAGSLGFPALVSLLLLQLNAANVAYGLSKALPIGAVLWRLFLVSVGALLPLQWLGNWLAARALNKHHHPDDTVSASALADALHKTSTTQFNSLTARRVVSMMTCAILPFAVIQISMDMCLRALLGYTTFPTFFTLGTLSLFFVNIAATTVVANHTRISKGHDAGWPWTAFVCGALPSVLCLGYSAVLYRQYTQHLAAGLTPTFITLLTFAVYSVVIAVTLGVSGGAVSYLSCRRYVGVLREAGTESEKTESSAFDRTEDPTRDSGEPSSGYGQVLSRTPGAMHSPNAAYAGFHGTPPNES